jgi:hypothetical protein
VAACFVDTLNNKRNAQTVAACGSVYTPPIDLPGGRVYICSMANKPRNSIPGYRSWTSMIDRCTNTKRHNYNRYAERGIIVCERWKDFENFLADMGERPLGLSIDRIDNDLGYSPDNCRWADAKAQSANSSVKSSKRYIDYTGKRFNRLTIDTYLRSDNKHSYWKAICDCGTECEVKARSFVRGHKQSCGCLLRERYQQQRKVNYPELRPASG